MPQPWHCSDLPDNALSVQRLFRKPNFQLLANSASRAVLDLSMTRHAGDLAEGRIQPDRVTATLAIKYTTLFAEVTLQVDPFHESGNSIDSRKASGEKAIFPPARVDTATPV